jgi:hypothetical protein
MTKAGALSKISLLQMIANKRLTNTKCGVKNYLGDVQGTF